MASAWRRRADAVTQRRQVAAAAAAAAGGVRLAAPRRQSSRRLGVAFIIPGRRLRISGVPSVALSSCRQTDNAPFYSSIDDRISRAARIRRLCSVSGLPVQPERWCYCPPVADTSLADSSPSQPILHRR